MTRSRRCSSLGAEWSVGCRGGGCRSGRRAGKAGEVVPVLSRAPFNRPPRTPERFGGRLSYPPGSNHSRCGSSSIASDSEQSYSTPPSRQCATSSAREDPGQPHPQLAQARSTPTRRARSNENRQWSVSGSGRMWRIPSECGGVVAVRLLYLAGMMSRCWVRCRFSTYIWSVSRVSGAGVNTASHPMWRKWRSRRRHRGRSGLVRSPAKNPQYRMRRS